GKGVPRQHQLGRSGRGAATHPSHVRRGPGGVRQLLVVATGERAVATVGPGRHGTIRCPNGPGKAGPAPARSMEGSRHRAGGPVPAGKTWTVTPSRRGEYAIRDATVGLLSGRLVGGPSRNLAGVRRADGAIKVGETGHTYKRGTLEFNLYAPCGRCAYRLRVI